MSCRLEVKAYLSSRYAIYVVPDDNALFQRVSQWLGWACAAAEALDLPLKDELVNFCWLRSKFFVFYCV